VVVGEPVHLSDGQINTFGRTVEPVSWFATPDVDEPCAALVVISADTFPCSMTGSKKVWGDGPQMAVSNEPCGNFPITSWKLWHASPICFMLLAHCMRAAASRTF
jgi:hypothetical protein